MGSSKKSRSAKRFSYINDVSPSKDADSDKKITNRKRKLSDMLGPQWGKEELERFYKAYRKYGKSWKKVAAAVRNRSVEMVEALYTMNTAYLSLPEGTASVVGLIAMMTDHYSNMAGSDSEQESNDGAGTSQRQHKQPRVKVKPSLLKRSDTTTHSNTASPSYGCLSLLKKRRSGGSRPRAVGKRTPRFPVSYSYENPNGEKYFSPIRQGFRFGADDNDDDEVAHEIALALAEASNRGGSPQVSGTPNRRTESVMSSPMRNSQRMQTEVRMTCSKLGGDMDENDLEGSTEADNGDCSRDKVYLMEGETSGKIISNGRRFNGSKFGIGDDGNDHIDDIKEACSGTEGQNLGRSKERIDVEVTHPKVSLSPSKVQKKRSKKALFKRDEGSDFDALQTLADLSLMMPAAANENESSVQVKEESADLIEGSGANHQSNKRKSSALRAKVNLSTSRLEIASEKASKPGKISISDVNANTKAQHELLQPCNKVPRKRQKISTSKTLKTDGQSEGHPSESQEAEAGDAGKNSLIKGKRLPQNGSPKMGKHLEGSSSSTDLKKEGSDTVQSTAQVSTANQVNLPTKIRSRRKMHLQKPHSLKVVNDHKNTHPSLHDTTTKFDFKENLFNSLSNARLRRWCTFEWFYSAIDYPWFAKREFVEYLYHVGLDHVPRLTQVEWGVIRSSLGKPRRFSEQFLKEEKEKLNQYRDSVRKHYMELRAGTRDGLPTDLAKPLSVGQRVIAIHPKTREIHDGSVLTVDHNRCRVQFDRPELGVEFVKDIDCMPSNPLENMPTLLARHMLTVDKFCENANELKLNGLTKDQRAEGYMKFSPGENVGVISNTHMTSSAYPINNFFKQVVPVAGPNGSTISQQATYSQLCRLVQIQAKEADVQALAELTRALDKKEAVVVELRRMNDDVLESQKDGDSSLKDSDPFKKQYAAILVQLNEVNEQVASALYCLRQRNTYQGSSQLACPRPAVNLGDTVGFYNSMDHPATQAQESGPQANEIVESSRIKACKMVDAAVQAISSLKVGGNTVDKIEEAIDYVNDRLPLDGSYMPTMRSSVNADANNCSVACTDQPNSNSINLLQEADSDLRNSLDKNETQIPSELIAHCVATLLMIQKCTERQFPPADVAQILDSAVTSLKPCCSQNLPVYAEIQKCMGIIKNQILALIPT